MIDLQKLNLPSVLPRLQTCLKSFYGSLILLGLFIGLCYLPMWAASLIDRGPRSSNGFTLSICLVGLSLYLLWKHHRQLTGLEASEEDRLLCHMLITAGVEVFPFCRFALWPQAILWSLVLAGIALSTWGVQTLFSHPLLAAAVLATVYPQPTRTTRLLWQGLIP